MRELVKRLGKWRFLALAFGINFLCLFVGMSLGKAVYHLPLLTDLRVASVYSETAQLAVVCGTGLAISALLMVAVYLLFPSIPKRGKRDGLSSGSCNGKQTLKTLSVGGVYLIWCIISILWPWLSSRLFGTAVIERLNQSIQNINVITGIGIYVAVAAALMFLPVPLLKQAMRNQATKHEGTS